MDTYHIYALYYNNKIECEGCIADVSMLYVQNEWMVVVDMVVCNLLNKTKHLEI